MTSRSGDRTRQSGPNWSPTSPTRSKITPARVTPSQSGTTGKLYPSTALVAKSQCGAPPTASIPKTPDQPEEAQLKHPRPSGNNASTGTSRVPPTRPADPKATSDRHEAPPVASYNNWQRPYRNPERRPSACRAPPVAHQASHRDAEHEDALDAATADRQHTAERLFLQIKSQLAGGACPRFAAGRAVPLLWCGSEVGLRPELIGVAAAVDLDARGQVVQLAEFGLGEGDVGGGEVLLESVHFGGAGDGHDPRPLLGEQPGERNLPGGGALGGCDGLDLLDECEVVFQRLAENRESAPADRSRRRWSRCRRCP